ncbi:MAG TPA: mechanosensitive ion channel domain-containing protein [Casimicrobiaceae bacterium]|nr:mechanosensitive ion channel domain-containing protein [Casimicrobiaceae bacterium]
MLTAIDPSRFQSALASPPGWIELALVGGSLAAAWAVGRRVNLTRENAPEVVRVGLGGINRLVFPLAALALVAVSLAVFRLFGEPFFLPIALPLLVALALIRILVYALRGLFGNVAWMTASERAISFAIWGLVVLYFLDVLPQIGAELDAMQLPVGKGRVSLLEIGKGIVVVLVTIAATLWVSGLIEQRLAGAESLNANLRVVLAKSIKALLIVVALLVALQAVGIDLTLLSVFGGALGVGIGLGLQKLASNYIAGFTILLDRSVRLGDMITVDGRHGIVSSVTARYVVVRSLDGVEAIVPNETLVTTTVLNHTYTSKNSRVAVTVPVSYDSDVDLALELMLAAGKGHVRVLKSPSPPSAQVLRFGENGIDLELGVWIGDPEAGAGDLRSALHREILAAFRKHGVRIPFPQREVRVVNADELASPRTDAPSRGPASGRR